MTAFDLLWHGGGYNTSVDPGLRSTDQRSDGRAGGLPAAAPDQLYPPTRQVAFLLSQPGPFRILGGDYTALAPNMAGAFGIEDIRGYQSLYFERYNRLARLVDGKDFSKTGEGIVNLRAYFSSAYKQRRLLDMLNVKYVLFEPGGVNPQLFAPLELVQENDEGRIYRNPNVLPRAWLVHPPRSFPMTTRSSRAWRAPISTPAWRSCRRRRHPSPRRPRPSRRRRLLRAEPGRGACERGAPAC